MYHLAKAEGSLHRQGGWAGHAASPPFCRSFNSPELGIWKSANARRFTEEASTEKHDDWQRRWLTNDPSCKTTPCSSTRSRRGCQPYFKDVSVEAFLKRNFWDSQTTWFLRFLWAPSSSDNSMKWQRMQLETLEIPRLVTLLLAPTMQSLRPQLAVSSKEGCFLGSCMRHTVNLLRPWEMPHAPCISFGRFIALIFPVKKKKRIYHIPTSCICTKK